MGMFSVTRALAQPFMESLIAKGYSRGQVFDVLDKAGITFRRTDFLADYRWMAGLPEQAYRLKYVPKKYAPPSAFIQQMPWDLSEDYMVRFTVKGTNLTTGVKEERTYALSKKELGSINSLEAEMSGFVMAEDESAGFRAESVLIRNVLQKMEPF